MKTVDVVIPVHNSVHWLAWCLEELFRFKSVKLRNTFVVNDRSESAQSEKVNEIVSRYSKATLINIEGNVGGFGYACNLAASKCSSDIILFLNTDCLLTEGVIDRLAEVFDTDSQIALACPFSNNSANLTYPVLPGFSYRDMAALFADITSSTEDNYVVEACTIVGNCLMVRRDFFEEVGGFSPEWGVGYGEETDLHMKALSRGLKGVVHTGCYVYHYGGGTFNYELEIEAHREQNYQLFMSKWAKEYKELSARCESINPIQIIEKNLEQYYDKNKVKELDVLFYLPGVDQGVGGVNAVIAICNDLIKKGIKASIALISGANDQLTYYKDPVLFNFVYFDSNESFLSDYTVLPKVVFSTIVWSGPIVAQYSSERKAVAVQFVQGYEGFFWNGTRYPESIDSYKSTDYLVTTSNWLFNMVRRHLSPDQNIQQLPLIVNKEVFFSTTAPRDIDIILVFRSSPDKGQWILAETLDRLISLNKSITVLCAADYSALKDRYKNQATFIDLPIDQYSLARILRRAKVFVDASLHEGYGLVPLEAALCGCYLVLSDSGGIRDFIHHYNGEIISCLLDVESIIDAINRGLDGFSQKAPTTPSATEIWAGEMWHSYFQNLTNSKPLPVFSTKLLNAREAKLSSSQVETENEVEIAPMVVQRIDPTVVLNQAADQVEIKETDTISTDSITKKVYKSIVLPYIPQRLHLALKVLITGRV